MFKLYRKMIVQIPFRKELFNKKKYLANTGIWTHEGNSDILLFEQCTM